MQTVLSIMQKVYYNLFIYKDHAESILLSNMQSWFSKAGW
jgi:hypothetical protein